MATVNPACTNGWTEPHPDGGHTAHCGCDWTDGPYDSKSLAKKAQRAHRFPASSTTAAAAPAHDELDEALPL